MDEKTKIIEIHNTRAGNTILPRNNEELQDHIKLQNSQDHINKQSEKDAKGHHNT